MFFGCVFKIQGSPWPGLGLRTIKPINTWENSKWNVHSAHCQLQPWPKQFEFQIWLHFLMGSGRSDQFYATSPCKTEGQYGAWEKAISTTPMLASRKKGHTQQINSDPCGSWRCCKTQHNLQSRSEPCRDKLALHTVEKKSFLVKEQ